MNTRSNYIAPMNNYVDLEKYNIDTQFGPPVPPSVPSMQFPTILEQKPIQSYEILTHETKQNYPDVNKAYGNNCQQKYYVAKCPTNQFIRPFGPSGERPTPTPIKENYTIPPDVSQTIPPNVSQTIPPNVENDSWSPGQTLNMNGNKYPIIESNYINTPILIQSEARVRQGLIDVMQVAYNSTDEAAMNNLKWNAMWSHMQIVPTSNGYTLMNNGNGKTFYLTTSVNKYNVLQFQETSINNALSFSIRPNNNGTFSFQYISNNQYFLCADKKTALYKGDIQNLPQVLLKIFPENFIFYSITPN